MLRTFEEFKAGDFNDSMSDTEAALQYLKHNFFPREVRFPPILFLHQIYSLIRNKTKVDKEASDLQMTGKIIIYKLGNDKDNIAEIVIFTQDVKDHILRQTHSRVVKKFIDHLPGIKNVFVDLNHLTDTLSLTNQDIRELVQENVLVIRDIGSYWLSFPQAGEFVKSYNCGRKEILRMIRKSKYSEILEAELRKRRLSKRATLGMAYHIADIIGSEAVKCIFTTSGNLLRYDS